MITFEFRQGSKVHASAVTATGADALVATCGRLGRAWKRSRATLRVVAIVETGKGAGERQEMVIARPGSRGLVEYLDPHLVVWEAAARERERRGDRKLPGLR